MIIDDNVFPPQHVACIMDGNGRWASLRGLDRFEGHLAGVTAALEVIDEALASGVSWLTLYAFSTENWDRPPDEVRFLMRLCQQSIRQYQDRLHQQGIRVRHLGTPGASRLPSSLVHELDELERLTAANRNMNVVFAFDHGGRSEIVHAVKSLMLSNKDPAVLDETAVSDHLCIPEMPDVDLVIRTSGEHRVSNFLLWRIAYAELIFTDVLWPDFGAVDLQDTFRVFRARSRRYGGNSDSVVGANANG